MMPESVVTTREPAAETIGSDSKIRGVMAKVRKALKLDIPVGYQDETGFHLGVKPAEKEVKWPPFW